MNLGNTAELTTQKQELVQFFKQKFAQNNLPNSTLFIERIERCLNFAETNSSSFLKE